MTSTKPSRKPAVLSKIELEVCLGVLEEPLGKLVYAREGRREFSQFAYDTLWLQSSEFFSISPDLQALPGFQLRKPSSKDDSSFFLALADTEPDAWGRRVIRRAHAKERRLDSALPPLCELDYLCAVDDFSRIGALRLRDSKKKYLKTVESGKRTTPPVLELEKMLNASHAVERNKESAEDLKYLLGKATSLGGMRPKCSVLDEDGLLSLAKFPSISDERSVTRGEALALHLAAMAGIDTALARIVMVQGTPVLLVRRFDRAEGHTRIPYMSGTTLLQTARGAEHAYTEIVEVMKSVCRDFKADAQQLWRRLVFNHLITNVDDHLHNIGFLYDGGKFWRMSPAFDLNPFPDKERESKTWLSEDIGPIVSIDDLIAVAKRFQLDEDEATQVLAQVVAALASWRNVAQSHAIGMSFDELDAFADAFEHSEFERALALVKDAS
jgi:serine/threonine-protein kinase HipA